jgi:hypothetical protein
MFIESKAAKTMEAHLQSNRKFNLNSNSELDESMEFKRLLNLPDFLLDSDDEQ